MNLLEEPITINNEIIINMINNKVYLLSYEEDNTDIKLLDEIKYKELRDYKCKKVLNLLLDMAIIVNTRYLEKLLKYADRNIIYKLMLTYGLYEYIELYINKYPVDLSIIIKKKAVPLYFLKHMNILDSKKSNLKNAYIFKKINIIKEYYIDGYDLKKKHLLLILSEFSIERLKNCIDNK